MTYKNIIKILKKIKTNKFSILIPISLIIIIFLTIFGSLWWLVLLIPIIIIDFLIFKLEYDEKKIPNVKDIKK